MSKDLGTERDSARLRAALDIELKRTESIAKRMIGEIDRIDNKAKREKLRNQLRKTRKELEELRKNIQKEERLNSLAAPNGFTGSMESTSDRWGSTINAQGGIIAEQSVEFQHWDGKIRAAEKRDAAIQLINKDMEQIADVFSSLKGLVDDQDPNIELLAQNAQDTNYNIKLAGEELDQAAELQQAKRKKKCMIIIFLIIIVVLLIIILVSVEV